MADEKSIKDLQPRMVQWATGLLALYNFGKSNKSSACIEEIKGLSAEVLFNCFHIFANALSIGIEDEKRAKGLLKSLENAYDFSEKMDSSQEDVQHSLRSRLDSFLSFREGLDREDQEISSEIRAALRSLTFKGLNAVVLLTAYALSLGGDNPEGAGRLYSQIEEIINFGMSLE